MAKSIQELKLTTSSESRHTKTPVTIAKLADAASRYLKATLYVTDDWQNRIEVPQTSSVYINAVKPDATKTMTLGTVNPDGSVTVPLSNQTLAVVGDVKCDISIIGADSSVLTTESFLIRVVDGQRDDYTIESTDEFSALSQTVAEAQAIITALGDTSNLQMGIVKNTAQIQTLESQFAASNPSGEARISITSPSDRVYAPINAARGGMAVKRCGNTLTNVATNPTFTSGTADWLSYAGTLSVSDNILRVTGDGTASYPYIHQVTSLAYTSGKKIYFKMRARTTVFGIISIQIKARGSTVQGAELLARTIPSPVPYQWYSGSGVFTMDGVGTGTLRLMCTTNYSSAAAAADTGLELAEVVLLDLTALGLESLTKEELDKMTAAPFAGTAHAISPRLRSVDTNGENPAYQYTDPYVLRRVGDVYDEIDNGRLIRRISESGTVLSAPIITENVTSGTLLSYPDGSIYPEHALADAGVYADGVAILHADFPISSLESVHKVDFDTGAQMPLTISGAVVAPDGKSFTHPDLAKGDIVFFTYFYTAPPSLSLRGSNTYGFLDSTVVVADGADEEMFYKARVTVKGGEPWVQLTDVATDAVTEFVIPEISEWITPPLLSGATGTFKYRKAPGNRVEFKGTLSIPSAASTPFILPEGYRPTADIFAPVASSTGAALASILTSGAIYVTANSTVYYFDHISYSLD